MMLFDWGCARADQDQDCALRRLDYARAGRHLWDMSAEPCLVRPAAVAGQFYPGTRDALSRSVAELLDEAPAAGPRPKALVVPHAGYVYSGPTAAAAYGLLHGLAGAIRRVVLLGPSHHVPLRGMAVPATAAFRQQAMTTQIYSFIMSLIDGNRSIKEMAAVLEKQRLMSKEEAIPAIRSFLTKMYDDAQRQTGY